jgi:uncharacterized protein
VQCRCPAGDTLGESQVYVRKIKDVHFRDGVLVEAFTGVGMVASIAANYLISSLKLDQVAAMDSNEFPPVSMVYNGRPKLPCRVYCSQEKGFAVFTSEIPLPARTHREVANELVNWATDAGCNSFISLDAIPTEEEEGTPAVWAIGASERARQKLERYGLKQLTMGMITGVSAIMLNKGRMENLDVIGLFAEARPFIPDAAAAAQLVETLKIIISDKIGDLSTEPLIEEAKGIQADLEKIRKQAEPAMSEPYNLYR